MLPSWRGWIEIQAREMPTAGIDGHQVDPMGRRILLGGLVRADLDFDTLAALYGVEW